MLVLEQKTLKTRLSTKERILGQKTKKTRFSPKFCHFFNVHTKTRFLGQISKKVDIFYQKYNTKVTDTGQKETKTLSQERKTP